MVPVGASVNLSCSNQRGAALLIKYRAEREDSNRPLALADCMLKNYKNWLAFARGRLFQDIELRDLVLVTGCDITRDWATATFTERSVDGSISFQAGAPSTGNAEVSFWGSWRTSTSIPHRCGPQSINNSFQNSGDSLIPTDDTSQRQTTPKSDQCIFIRAYRVHERPMFLPNVIRAAAGPSDLPKYHPDASSPSTVIAGTQGITGSLDGIETSPDIDGRVRRRSPSVG